MFDFYPGLGLPHMHMHTHIGSPTLYFLPEVHGYNVPDHEDAAIPVGLPSGVSSRVQLSGGLYQV